MVDMKAIYLIPTPRQHTINDKTLLLNYTEFKEPKTVAMGNNKVHLAYGHGVLVLEDPRCESPLPLVSVVYVPESINFLSIDALRKEGYSVSRVGDDGEVRRDNETVMFTRCAGKAFFCCSTPRKQNLSKLDDVSSQA